MSRSQTSETAKAWRSATSGTSPASQSRICFCVGPQDGAPVCPCRMPALEIRDGRWIEIIDHGPAKS
jgi:hypothetical protein